MKSLLLLAALAVLTGCASTGFSNTQVVVQKDYIVRTAPDTLKTLPQLPPPLANPKLSTNTQIATWISNTEEYVANLEAMVSTLVDFYEKPVTVSEAGTMRTVTPTTDSTGRRVLQPQAGTKGAATASTTAASAPAPASRFSTPLERLRGE